MLREKAARSIAAGWERYVATPMRFGKGRERSFRGFMTVETRYLPRQAAGESGLARSSAKAQPCGQRGGGKTHDGHIRFCGGGRRLRRLRGREPALRGSRDVGGAAGSRRRVQQLGRNLAGRDDPDDLGQGQQLGVRYGTTGGPQTPGRPSTPRTRTQRVLRDSSHGIL